MPQQNLTDEHIAYRAKFAASAVRDGSELVADLIAAGPHVKVHRVAFLARDLRESVQRLTADHPQLAIVADSLAVEERVLWEYAEAIAA